MVAATKAMDRVLLWNHYVVPQWTYGKVRTARWDRFGRPDRCRNTASRLPDHLVVGRGQGGQDGVALVNVALAPRRSDHRRRRRGIRRNWSPPSRNPPQDAERHGISSFGDLKYPADFPHFDYVNPKAPKGGLFSQIGPSRQFNQSFLTFNSLNSYILQGDAAQGMELTFASLMVRASDEPDALYGLAARAVRISADGLTYRYPAAARGEIPRRHAADRARCRLLAERS